MAAFSMMCRTSSRFPAISIVAVLQPDDAIDFHGQTGQKCGFNSDGTDGVLGVSCSEGTVGNLKILNVHIGITVCIASLGGWLQSACSRHSQVMLVLFQRP